MNCTDNIESMIFRITASANMPNRRIFLKTLTATALALPASAERLVAQTTGLRYKAAAKNMFYGAASSSQRLRTDAPYRQAIQQECGILTPEYEMKWDTLRPTSTTYNFTDADYFVNFARQNTMYINGHTLCWHRALPSWFSATVNARNAEQFLRQHIQTVVGRYRGQIQLWDVVNEAIEPSDNRPNGLRNSPWYQFLGERYLDIAFRTAAETDPSALLVYNEYGVEYDDASRRNAILGLLRRLISRGVPVHALGIQGHIRAQDRSKLQANFSAFRQFLSDVAALGLKIFVSEFDCDDGALTSNTAARDAAIAQIYGDYCSVVMNNPAVIGFITWGLTDKYTELQTSAIRPDRLPQRPLPLDSSFVRKSAWYSLEFWFNSTASRPRFLTDVRQTLARDASGILNVRTTPNPASTHTTISFVLSAATNVHLSVADVAGRVMVTLADTILASGEHRFRWDTDTVSGGLYWLIVRTSQGQSAFPLVVQH